MSSIHDIDQPRREELANFLRDRRARMQPESVGINVRRRRRARGLLREEVASIAGVSITWYTWLEQARPTNPSARTLDGLSKALRLDETERAHLYRLARPDLNPNMQLGASETLPSSLLALLEGLAPHPAYAINARWDVLAWNHPAERVFGGFAHLSAGERNVLHRLLYDRTWLRLFVEYEAIIQDAIAQFRATTVHLASDAAMKQFISHLHATSERFKTLWDQQEVARPHALRKRLRHETAGLLSFDYATLRPDGAPRDVRITVYTPADTMTRRRLVELLARD